MMKKLMVLLALVPVLAVGASPPPEREISKSKRALIEEFMHVSGVYALGISELADGWLKRKGFDPTAFPGNAADLEYEDLMAAAEVTLREDRPPLRASAEATYVPMIDELFTEEQLERLIRFYRTEDGQRLSLLNLALHTAASEELTALQGIAMMERQAKADTAIAIRSIAVSVEAWEVEASDDGFPRVETIGELAELLEPDYALSSPEEGVLPRRDGWGREIRWICDGRRYRIVSAGEDGKFDEGSLEIGATPAGGDDYIYENMRFLQMPQF